MEEHMYYGRKSIKTASFLAAIIFNKVYKAILRTIMTLDMTIAQQINICAEKRDENCTETQHATTREQESDTQETRIARKKDSEASHV